MCFAMTIDYQQFACKDIFSMMQPTTELWLTMSSVSRSIKYTRQLGTHDAGVVWRMCVKSVLNDVKEISR